MGAGKSTNFEPAFFDKYATAKYFLSKGSSGNVYGPIKWRGSKLAIKQALFADGNVTDAIKRRIGLEEKKYKWISLEHKNLMTIRWVDLTRLPKVMFIVMDFAAGGSLHNTLRSLAPAKIPIDVVTDWAKQIVDGMLYLHDKDIVHRDVKSSNILLMGPFVAGNPHNTLTLKIADFDEIKDHDQTATMSTLVGTWAYMAPEVIRKQRFSKASDVWSFGVVIWEMLSGKIPHKGRNQYDLMYNSIKRKLKNLPMEPSFPKDYKVLLKRCWESTHGERISFHDIYTILQRIVDSAEEEPRKLVLSDGGNHIPRTIRPMQDEHRGRRVKGLTILNDELFVAFEMSAVIEIFHIDISTSIRSAKVEVLGRPGAIAACAENNCLYIVDTRHNARKQIIRFDPLGAVICAWKTHNDDNGRISVNRDGNVVMTIYDKHKVKIYSPEGKLIEERTIDFKGSPITFMFHAINLDDGNFILCHGMFDSKVHRVCKVDPRGKVLRSFGSEKGLDEEHLSSPAYLAERNDGSILVADQDNDRIILLNSDLTFKNVLFTEKDGVSLPEAMHVYEKTGSSSLLFLGCNETRNSGGYVSVLRLGQ